MLGLLIVISIFYVVMVLVMLEVVSKKHDRKLVVGSICVIIGVFMYGAPLAVMVNKMSLHFIPRCTFMMYMVELKFPTSKTFLSKTKIPVVLHKHTMGMMSALEGERNLETTSRGGTCQQIV